jgi:hypothetical protein
MACGHHRIRPKSISSTRMASGPREVSPVVREAPKHSICLSDGESLSHAAPCPEQTKTPAPLDCMQPPCQPCRRSETLTLAPSLAATDSPYATAKGACERCPRTRPNFGSPSFNRLARDNLFAPPLLEKRERGGTLISDIFGSRVATLVVLIFRIRRRCSALEPSNPCTGFCRKRSFLVNCRSSANPVKEDAGPTLRGQSGWCCLQVAVASKLVASTKRRCCQAA